MTIRLAPKSALAEASAQLTHTANRNVGLTAERRADLHDAADTLADLVAIADAHRITTIDLQTAS